MSRPPRHARARSRAHAHRGWRAIALLAIAVLVPVLAGIGLWRAAATTPLVPGLGGCRFVRDRAPQLECVTDRMRGIVADEGLRRALVRVDERAQASTAIGADCHVGWHPIGEEHGRRDARAGRPYDNVTARTTCQQGYAHGYTIGFIGERTPTDEELARMVEAECGGSTGLNALFNCTHAYGHVIARLGDGDPAAGIRACERVDYASLPGTDVASPVPGERPPVLVGAEHQCLYGMYMEVAILDLADGDDTLDNCGTATTAAARKACYAYLPARVNAIVGDLEAAARSCGELAPSGDLRDSCVKTFSIGLQRREDCVLLRADAEQDQCRRTWDLARNQQDLLAFADGDPDGIGASVRVAPEPGVDAPDAPPAAPAPGPPA